MSNKGFTLIEMMIVIAIIGILSAVSLYGWLGYQDNLNLRTAAGEVMADIASCKQRAVSEGCEYFIQFTDGSPNYSISFNGPPQFTTCTTAPQTQAKNLTSFGSGLTISNTNFTSDLVSFIPRGTLSSNTGRIVLTNSKNSTATITVQITGKAYVSFTMQ